jgi:hypothetical protein
MSPQPIPRLPFPPIFSHELGVSPTLIETSCAQRTRAASDLIPSPVSTLPDLTLLVGDCRLLGDFRLARGHDDLAAYAFSALRWQSATLSEH